MSSPSDRPTAGLGLTIVLGAVAALGAAAIDMNLPALPAIDGDLGGAARGTQGFFEGGAELTLSAFLVGMGLGQLVYGALSDAFGRRRVLIASTVIYVGASIACAFAESLDQLVLFRFLQAMGAGGGVISRAIVRDLYSVDAAAKAQSFIQLVFLLTPLLAPNIGGYVLLWFGWRAIFFVLMGFALFCLVTTVLRVPETLPEEKRRPLSIVNLARGYATVLSNRNTLGCIVCAAFTTSCMFTFFAESPFVYIQIFGVPAENYGLLFAMNVVGIMAANFVNARVVERMGAFRMLRIGVFITAASGLTLLATACFEIGGLWGIVLPVVLVVGSMGLVSGNAIAGALAPFPTLAGSAAALLGLVSMWLGATMGAVVGALHDGTPMPMATVIAVLSVLALASNLLLVRDTR
jgi:DHA1 family bicyclomycin/chloramphenicol resistance-like MFS transporter